MNTQLGTRALLVGGLLAAQLAIGQGAPSFEDADIDGSGSLSLAELTDIYNRATSFGIDLGPTAVDFFARLDSDDSGDVSREEFENRP